MGIEDMTAAEAALEAARLGLIGTIAVGILAALTTLVGTLLAPWLIRRSDARAKQAERRRQELAEIIPDVIVKGIRGMSSNAGLDALSASLEAHAKLGVLLSPDEWQVAAIAHDALMGVASTSAMKRAGEAARLLTTWARGEIDSAEAASIYTRDTGREVTRVKP